jgi:uncharacterized protein YjbI with pentapeptide repeats
MPEESTQDARYSKKQHDLLLKCSKLKDTSEWNRWVIENGHNREFEPHKAERIMLDGADLENAWLCGAMLSGALLRKARLGGADLRRAQLMNARLEGAFLHGADLRHASLVHAVLDDVHTNSGTLMVEANLIGASFAGTSLSWVDLKGAALRTCNFRNSHFQSVRMRGAKLERSDMRGSFWHNVDLRGADLSRAIVDGETCLWDLSFDDNTDFGGVALAGARLQPGLMASLEACIRRQTWRKWCSARHALLAWPVRMFWWLSDYGTSTLRIAASFSLFALVFALIYYSCPSLIAHLHKVGDPSVDVALHVLPVRALYFSIVTMTTLGFGDMYASPNGVLGHGVLALQVMIGYALLGALIVRIGLLFQAVGPAVVSCPPPEIDSWSKGEED